MSANQAKISLLVHPGAARSEVINFTDGVWQVRVAAPPVKGKANKELLSFLSKVLGVPQCALTIVRGNSGRHKLIAIDSLSREDITRRLSLSVKPSSYGDATTSRTRRQ